MAVQDELEQAPVGVDERVSTTIQSALAEAIVGAIPIYIDAHKRSMDPALVSALGQVRDALGDADRSGTDTTFSLDADSAAVLSRSFGGVEQAVKEVPTKAYDLAVSPSTVLRFTMGVHGTTQEANAERAARAQWVLAEHRKRAASLAQFPARLAALRIPAAAELVAQHRGQMPQTVMSQEFAIHAIERGRPVRQREGSGALYVQVLKAAGLTDSEIRSTIEAVARGNQLGRAAAQGADVDQAERSASDQVTAKPASVEVGGGRDAKAVPEREAMPAPGTEQWRPSWEPSGVFAELDSLGFPARMTQLRSVGMLSAEQQEQVLQMARDSNDLLPQFRARLEYDGAKILEPFAYKYLTSAVSDAEPVSWEAAGQWVRDGGLAAATPQAQGASPVDVDSIMQSAFPDAGSQALAQTVQTRARAPQSSVREPADVVHAR